MASGTLSVWRRRILRLGLAAVLGCGVAASGLGLYFVLHYKGFVLSAAAWGDIPFRETVDRLRVFYYWSEFLDELRLDPVSGFYEFGDPDSDRGDGFELGRMSYHRGDFEAAIREIERAIDRHGRSERRLFWLALSYMRRGEADNCLALLLEEAGPPPPASGLGAVGGTHHHHDLCSLPLGRFHERAESSRKAARLLEELLGRRTRNEELYRWLLNFSYMTVGGFPEEVPEKHRIRGSFADHFYGETRRDAEARYRHLSFEDRAGELNADVFDSGKGVAVEDFDGDGFLDIVTGGTFGTLRYLANEGGTGFADRTEASGLARIAQPHIVSAADYDNDGRMDLFVGSLFHPFSLLRNNGDATFTDVTSSSGLLEGGRERERTMTWIPTWGDVDNDGDLDLFVCQWSIAVPSLFFGDFMSAPRMESKLFVNQDGHFVDATERYGLARIVHDNVLLGAAFGDYDEDGYADLLVSSALSGYGATLLASVAGKRFEAVEDLDLGSASFAVAFVDVDHDGRLDIFQAASADGLTSTGRAVFREEGSGASGSGHSSFLLQDENGRFAEPRELFEGEMPIGTMGASYGDLDNDGCYELYLGTGSPEGWFVLPNLMYAGQLEGKRCTGRLRNISMLHGFGTVQKGHGIVFFDFDNDGDQDVYSSLGGMWPGDRWPNQLFVNGSELSNNWVKIRLRGRRTNRFGVGAKVRVTALDAAGVEIVRYHHMDQKTGFGSAPYLAHVGLANAIEIREIEVYWPGSGCRRAYSGRLNSLHVLDESECSIGPAPRTL